MDRIHATGQNGTVIFDGTDLTIIRTGLARLTARGADRHIPVSGIAELFLQPAGVLLHGFVHVLRTGSVRRPSSGDGDAVVRPRSPLDATEHHWVI